MASNSTDADAGSQAVADQTAGFASLEPADDDGVEWEIRLDEASGAAYYYNTRTGEASWDAPAGVRTSELLQLTSGRAGGTTAATSDELQWTEAFDDSDRVYYVNVQTMETRWDPPAEYEAAAISGHDGGGNDSHTELKRPSTAEQMEKLNRLLSGGDDDDDEDGGGANEHEPECDESSGTAETVTASSELALEPTANVLAASEIAAAAITTANAAHEMPWMMFLNESDGMPYYYNHVTGECVWEPPEEFTAFHKQIGEAVHLGEQSSQHQQAQYSGADAIDGASSNARGSGAYSAGSASAPHATAAAAAISREPTTAMLVTPEFEAKVRRAIESVSKTPVGSSRVLLVRTPSEKWPEFSKSSNDTTSTRFRSPPPSSSSVAAAGERTEGEAVLTGHSAPTLRPTSSQSRPSPSRSGSTVINDSPRDGPGTLQTTIPETADSSSLDSMPPSVSGTLVESYDPDTGTFVLVVEPAGTSQLQQQQLGDDEAVTPTRNTAGTRRSVRNRSAMVLQLRFDEAALVVECAARCFVARRRVQRRRIEAQQQQRRIQSPIQTDDMLVLRDSSRSELAEEQGEAHSLRSDDTDFATAPITEPPVLEAASTTPVLETATLGTEKRTDEVEDTALGSESAAPDSEEPVAKATEDHLAKSVEMVFEADEMTVKSEGAAASQVNADAPHGLAAPDCFLQRRDGDIPSEDEVVPPPVEAVLDTPPVILVTTSPGEKLNVVASACALEGKADVETPTSSSQLQCKRSDVNDLSSTEAPVVAAASIDPSDEQSLADVPVADSMNDLAMPTSAAHDASPSPLPYSRAPTALSMTLAGSDPVESLVGDDQRGSSLPSIPLEQLVPPSDEHSDGDVAMLAESLSRSARDEAGDTVASTESAKRMGDAPAPPPLALIDAAASCDQEHERASFLVVSPHHTSQTAAPPAAAAAIAEPQQMLSSVTAPASSRAVAAAESVFVAPRVLDIAQFFQIRRPAKPAVASMSVEAPNNKLVSRSVPPGIVRRRVEIPAAAHAATSTRLLSPRERQTRNELRVQAAQAARVLAREQEAREISELRRTFEAAADVFEREKRDTLQAHENTKHHAEHSTSQLPSPDADGRTIAASTRNDTESTIWGLLDGSDAAVSAAFDAQLAELLDPATFVCAMRRERVQELQQRIDHLRTLIERTDAQIEVIDVYLLINDDDNNNTGGGGTGDASTAQRRRAFQAKYASKLRRVQSQRLRVLQFWQMQLERFSADDDVCDAAEPQQLQRDEHRGYWRRVDDHLRRIVASPGATRDFALQVLRDANGDSLLHAAAWRGQRDAVTKLLALGADVHAVDNLVSRSRVLHEACRGGHLAVVRELVAAGAQLNAADAAGDTPLHVACRLGCTSVVRFLLTAASERSKSKCCDGAGPESDVDAADRSCSPAALFHQRNRKHRRAVDVATRPSLLALLQQYEHELPVMPEASVPAARHLHQHHKKHQLLHDRKKSRVT